jgi:hypothetical protein
MTPGIREAMRLPNADRSVVDIEKLRAYCLSAAHVRGRHKARVFASSLGLSAADAEFLRNALLAAAKELEAEVAEEDQYGRRYLVDFPVERAGKRAMVRSTWIIRQGEDFPRLTSCYVL